MIKEEHTTMIISLRDIHLKPKSLSEIEQILHHKIKVLEIL